MAVVALADEIQLFGRRLAIHPALRLEQIGDDRGVSPGIAAVWRPWREGSALEPVAFQRSGRSAELGLECVG